MILALLSALMSAQNVDEVGADVDAVGAAVGTDVDDIGAAAALTSMMLGHLGGGNNSPALGCAHWARNPTYVPCLHVGMLKIFGVNQRQLDAHHRQRQHGVDGSHVFQARRHGELHKGPYEKSTAAFDDLL